MAFLSTFIIDRKTYRVLKCTPTLEQLIDNSGKVKIKQSSGQILLVVAAKEVEDILELRAWFEDANLPKEGSILFYNQKKSKQYTIEFSSAYCNTFKMHFKQKDADIVRITLTITAQYIEVNSIDYSYIIM